MVSFDELVFHILAWS